jgi:hypothetical protein
LTQATRRRTWAPSRTSSWTNVARWIISTIAAIALVGGVARGVAGEQDQRPAQLLAAEATDVVGHVAHRARGLDDLSREDLAHARQALGDGLEQAFEARAGRAHPATSALERQSSR